MKKVIPIDGDSSLYLAVYQNDDPEHQREMWVDVYDNRGGTVTRIAIVQAPSPDMFAILSNIDGLAPCEDLPEIWRGPLWATREVGMVPVCDTVLDFDADFDGRANNRNHLTARYNQEKRELFIGVTSNGVWWQNIVRITCPGGKNTNRFTVDFFHDALRCYRTATYISVITSERGN